MTFADKTYGTSCVSWAGFIVGWTILMVFMSLFWNILQTHVIYWVGASIVPLVLSCVIPIYCKWPKIYQRMTKFMLTALCPVTACLGITLGTVYHLVPALHQASLCLHQKAVKQCMQNVTLPVGSVLWDYTTNYAVPSTIESWNQHVKGIHMIVFGCLVLPIVMRAVFNTGLLPWKHQMVMIGYWLLHVCDVGSLIDTTLIAAKTKVFHVFQIEIVVLIMSYVIIMNTTPVLLMTYIVANMQSSTKKNVKTGFNLERTFEGKPIKAYVEMTDFGKTESKVAFPDACDEIELSRNSAKKCSQLYICINLGLSLFMVELPCLIWRCLWIHRHGYGEPGDAMVDGSFLILMIKNILAILLTVTVTTSIYILQSNFTEGTSLMAAFGDYLQHSLQCCCFRRGERSRCWAVAVFIFILICAGLSVTCIIIALYAHHTKGVNHSLH